MHALVLERPNQLAYKRVPTPRPAGDEVLVAVRACGICGSDVHGLDGSTGRRMPPIIMGHEAAGIIAQLGRHVSGWEVGQRVTFDSTLYCGRCYFCRRGQVNLCQERRVLGVSCREYRRDGAMADYVRVPARALYRLPAGLGFDEAAMVEPLSVALHAVRLSRLGPADRVLVVGTGVIGLLIVQVVRAAGSGSVIAMDVEPSRLELARRLGADIALDPRLPEAQEAVNAHTDGHGADVAFEAVGVPAAFRTAVAGVKNGGTVVLIGNVTPAVELPLQDVVTRQVRLQGSCASAGEYPDCLELMARGAVEADALISARAPLAEGAVWFERLRRREPRLLKVILLPGETADVQRSI